MSEPEGGVTPPKASMPKAKVSTVAHPGTGCIDITSSSVAGVTPLPGDGVNAGELMSAPGVPLLRVSLPHRLLFNVELVVRAALNQRCVFKACPKMTLLQKGQLSRLILLRPKIVTVSASQI